MQTPSNWPEAGKLGETGAWRDVWNARYAEYDKGVRREEGHMTKAHSAGPKWFGGLNVKDLKDDGFVDVECAVCDADCRSLAELGPSLPMARIHGNAYISRALSVVLMRPKEADEEMKAHRSLPTGHHRCTPRQTKLVERVVQQLCDAAGKPPEAWPFVEMIKISDLCEPQPWHADFMASGPVLAATLVLSEEAMPTYFINLSTVYKDEDMKLHRKWVGSEEKPGVSETEAATMLQLRAERWRVVHRSGNNNSVHVPVDGPSHAKLGVTQSGKASAVRRVTQYGNRSRERGGMRATRPRGSAVFFDATSPHRGPGRAKGESERYVLYVTWAGQGACKLGSGIPWLAHPPPRVRPMPVVGKDYGLLFDAAGTLLLEERMPIHHRGEGPKRRKRVAAESCEGSPSSAGALAADEAGSADLMSGTRGVPADGGMEMLAGVAGASAVGKEPSAARAGEDEDVLRPSTDSD